MDEFHFMHCFPLILSLWLIPSYDPSKKGVGLKWIDKIQHWSLERYKARLLVLTKAFLSHKQLQPQRNQRPPSALSKDLATSVKYPAAR
jgi:hypothetical protein